MNTLIFYIILFFTITVCTAQDYFAVVTKNDATTYRYPATATFKLLDAEGIAQPIDKGDAVTVTGDYRLLVSVPWKETPDVITSDGGTLEIFILKNNWSATTTAPAKAKTSVNYTVNDRSKPRIERKVVTPSAKNPETFNLLLVFTNGFVFSYTDGDTRAYENGAELPIEGSYVMTGSNETLKLSYHPRSQELWYVFENNKM